MVKSISKKGRPQAVFRTSWGEQIIGLFKLADGRWRVSGKEKITFSEADERLAVARFREIESKQNPQSNLGQAIAHSTFGAAFLDVLNRADAVGGTIKTQLGSPSVNDGKFVVTDETLSIAQWAWLRAKLLTEPKWVAERVGLEKIGWFKDFTQPTVSPTLKAIGELYFAKPQLSPNEAGRSRLFWKEFSRAVVVGTIREITHDHIANYEKKITGGTYAPKSILHRYRKVRTILAFAIKRGHGVEDCRRALDITAILEVKDHASLDPKPIKPADFWAIYNAADKAEDRTFTAMLLTALNMAAYPGEAAALRWDEVDLKTGELVTRRPKTGVSRVAVLWPETLKAIKAIPRRGEFIFNTRVRSFTVFSALDCWRKFRKAAGLGDDILFGMIRDAAFTIACQTSLDQARVLAGHRLPGASDNYLRRVPQFVADACRAIRTQFFSHSRQRLVR
jgi:integrase